MKNKIIMILSALFLATILVVAHKTNVGEEEIIVEPTMLLSNITHKEVTVEELKPDPIAVATKEMQAKMDEIESIEDNMEWFIAYKDIVFKYSEWFGIPTTVFDWFEPDEVMLVCRAVETECYQQDFDSKCNVASVIFNRYDSGEFGENIEEIITSENQFAYWRKEVAEDTILAVMYAFEIEDTTDGALYFHSNKKTDTFCGAKYIFTDKSGHHFYK